MQSMARSLISLHVHFKKALEWPARMKHRNRIVNKFLIPKQKKPRYLFLLLHSINLCVTLLFLKAFFFSLSSSYCLILWLETLSFRDCFISPLNNLTVYVTNNGQCKIQLKRWGRCGKNGTVRFQ